MVERFENDEQEDWNEEDSWGLDDDEGNDYIQEATTGLEEVKQGEELGHQKVF